MNIFMWAEFREAYEYDMMISTVKEFISFYFRFETVRTFYKITKIGQ